MAAMDIQPTRLEQAIAQTNRLERITNQINRGRFADLLDQFDARDKRMHDIMQSPPWYPLITAPRIPKRR